VKAITADATAWVLGDRRCRFEVVSAAPVYGGEDGGRRRPSAGQLLVYQVASMQAAGARKGGAARYYARTMQIHSEWAMRAFRGLGRDQA
jgi:hypothetical protein